MNLLKIVYKSFNYNLLVLNTKSTLLYFTLFHPISPCHLEIALHRGLDRWSRTPRMSTPRWQSPRTRSDIKVTGTPNLRRRVVLSDQEATNYHEEQSQKSNEINDASEIR